MRSRRGARFQEAPQDRMPIREAPVDVNEPSNGPRGRAETEFGSDLETGGESPAADAAPDHEAGPATNANGGVNGPGSGSGSGNGTPVVRGSRWIDYDTHELLEMIGNLEDERRWARLREGVLWAVLIHILVLFALFMIPRYVLKMRPVIQTDNLRDQKEFTYLDAPFVPKPKLVTPLTHAPQIDQKTLDELKQQAPPAPPPPQEQAPVEQNPQPTQPVPPSPQSQSQVEAPRPPAVPARPNLFTMNSGNTAEQLQHDMQNAMHSRGGDSVTAPGPGGLPLHPGAGAGGAQILSDTQGVDFRAWLEACLYETKRSWDPLIPDEVNPPITKQGQVMIRFKVLPNGRLMDGSLVLEGRSGDVALDRAAWGALTGSSYPPLPRDFHGPYIEMRILFLYNMEAPQQ
jgi:TonB family protein